MWCLKSDVLIQAPAKTLPRHAPAARAVACWFFIGGCLDSYSVLIGCKGFGAFDLKKRRKRSPPWKPRAQVLPLKIKQPR